MKTKWLGVLSLLTLILTTLWLILMIWSLANSGPLDTFTQVLDHVGKIRKSGVFELTYLNAGLLTIAAIALMGGLYIYVKTTYPEWSRVGLVFVPIYGTINLFVYLSQITLVPALMQAASDPMTANTALLLLQQSLQLSPGSTVGFFNNLAYAILGIPSIIFGRALTTNQSIHLRISGWLLALNGIACIVGIIGYGSSSDILSMGSVLGGAIFWLALFPMTYDFLRRHDE